MHFAQDLNRVELTGRLADDPQILPRAEGFWVEFLLSVRGGWLLMPEGRSHTPVYLVKGVATGEAARQLLTWTCGMDISVTGSLDLIVGGDGVLRPRWELAVRAQQVERRPATS